MLYIHNEENLGTLGRKILEKYNITKNSHVVVKLKLNENMLRQYLLSITV